MGGVPERECGARGDPPGKSVTTSQMRFCSGIWKFKRHTIRHVTDGSGTKSFWESPAQGPKGGDKEDEDDVTALGSPSGVFSRRVVEWPDFIG